MESRWRTQRDLRHASAVPLPAGSTDATRWRTQRDLRHASAVPLSVGSTDATQAQAPVLQLRDLDPKAYVQAKKNVQNDGGPGDPGKMREKPKRRRKENFPRPPVQKKRIK